MRRLLLLHIALLIPFCLVAQRGNQSNLDWNNYVKYWDDGRLEYGDFSAVRNAGFEPERIAYIDLGLTEENSRKGKSGNLVYHGWGIKVYMNKMNSWMIPDLMTPSVLEYSQTLFDMVEAIGRKYQLDLNKDPNNTAKIRNFYHSLLSSSISNYERETNYGRDTSVVAFYAARVKEQLAETNHDVPVPDVFKQFKPHMGMRFILGYSGEVYLGGTGKYTTTGNGFTIGIGFGLSNGLWIDTSLSPRFCTLKKGGIHDSKVGYDWVDGKEARIGDVLFTVSYPVVNEPYYAVSPMLGFGVAEYSQSMPEEYWSKNKDDHFSSMDGFRMTAGLTFDYKFHRVYDGLMYIENPISFCFYGAYSFLKTSPGFSINFGVLWRPSCWFK